MNTNCEDGQHVLGTNAWVEILNNVPISVTHGAADDQPPQEPPFKIPSRTKSIDQLAAAIETFVAAWVEPIVEADLVIDLGSAPETRSAAVTLLPNQPSHVRHVWWPEGETLEGHPTHALEMIAVRVVGGVALDRNGVAAPAPRGGAQSRLVPIHG